MRPRQNLDLSSFLPSIFRNLAEGISASLSRSYSGEDINLTVTEWRILLQLAEHQSLSASQIVSNTTMDKSKVSRALSSMEGNGVVQRTPDPTDHRRQSLQLTDYGLHLYRQLVPRALEWEKELIQGLDVSEYRDLLYLLDKLKQRLQAMN